MKVYKVKVNGKVYEVELEAVDEVNRSVETVKEEVQEKPVKAETEKPVTDKKIKQFGDNEKVVIKCVSLAGKELSLPTRSVEFDETGKCEVTGVEANRLLTIPGYELSK